MAGGAFLVQYGYGFTPGCGYQFTTAVFLMDFAPEMLLFLFKTRKNSSLCSRIARKACRDAGFCGNI